MPSRVWLCLALAVAAHQPLHAEGKRVFDTPGYKITLTRHPDVDESPWKVSIVDKRGGKTSEWSFEDPSDSWREARVFGDRAILLGNVGELTGTIAILDLGARRERDSLYGYRATISPDGRYVAYIGLKPTHGEESGRPDELFVYITGVLDPAPAATADEGKNRQVRIFRGKEAKPKPGQAPEHAVEETISRSPGLLWLHGSRDLAFLVEGSEGRRLMLAELAKGPRAAKILGRDLKLGKSVDRSPLVIKTMRDAGSDGIEIEFYALEDQGAAHRHRAPPWDLP